MPKRKRESKQLTQNVRSNPKRRKTNRSGPGGSKGSYGPRTRLPKEASMLLDPCGSTLRPGLHSTSEGILSRFKTSITINPTAVEGENGFIIWSPHYVSEVATAHECCIQWEDAVAAQLPLNTVGTPYGTGGANTTNAINVGASSFVSSATCADFRLVSSCMKISYTGPVNSCAGLITPITNIPADAVLHGNGGNPMSIDDFFAMSSQVKRVSLDTMELRHRPDAALSDAFKGSHDALWTKGVPATNVTVMSSEAKRFDPTVYGFAWKGVPAGTLEVSFIQNIEWRPDAGLGIVATIPKQLHAPGYAETIMRHLDKMFPNWQTEGANLAKSQANNLISSVFSGTFFA